MLQEYRWLDFSSEAIVFPDNPRATLVINDLHDPEELRKRVQVPKAFGMKFRPAAAPLFPVDLSEDYRKFVAETIQRRKRRNFDDDEDAAEIDFSEISTPPDLEDRLTRWKSRKNEDENQAETGSRAGAAGGSPIRPSSPHFAAAAGSPSNAFVPDGLATGPSDQKNDGGARGNASEARRGMRPAPDISQEARDRILAKLNASTGIGGSGLQPSTSETETNEGLLAVEAGDVAESAEASDDHAREGDDSSASGLARDSVDAHLPAARGDVGVAEEAHGPRTDDAEKTYAAAFQSGYESALDKFRDLFAALESTSNEIQALRSKVLTEGRDIFLEIIKLTAEGVLRSQLAFSDDALGDLFGSALENVHQARRITVQANSETLERLKLQFSEAKLEFEAIDWVSNDKIARGDFKVISKDEVIKVDLENLVSKKVAALAKDIFSTATVEQQPHASQEKTEQDTNSSDDKEAS